MHTLTLQAIKHPSHVDILLRELVQTLGVVPEGAYEVCDRNTLPDALQRLAECADHTGQSWACWIDDTWHAWFFIAEMPPPTSLERGIFVLQVDEFREDGLIRGTGRWVADRAGEWSRCSSG